MSNNLPRYGATVNQWVHLYTSIKEFTSGVESSREKGKRQWFIGDFGCCCLRHFEILWWIQITSITLTCFSMFQQSKSHDSRHESTWSAPSLPWARKQQDVDSIAFSRDICIGAWNAPKTYHRLYCNLKTSAHQCQWFRRCGLPLSSSIFC